MQTIFRTAPASNFTLLANDLVNTPMPFKAKEVLFYLLAKPKDWRVKVADIRNTLALTTHTIRKSLEWLQQAGYAGYVRLKTGHTIWKIFDRPQVAHQTETAYSPRVMPQTVMPHMAKPSVLQITKTEEIKKPLPDPEPIPEQKSIVVVADELVFPAQLNPDQKKAAKHIIKKVKQPELQQPVLFALAYAMVNQKINSVPAYLQGLVTRANNGTFEPVGSAPADPEGGKPLIPLWRGFKASTPSEPEKAKGFIQQAKQALRGMANKPIEGVI